MKTSHWYKVLVLGGAALAVGCLDSGKDDRDGAAAADTSGDSGAPLADASSEGPDAASGCRVPCSGGTCWG